MSESSTQPAPTGGDQNRGPTVEIVTWIFTSIALITVLLRLLTRLRITRNSGWDDFWIGLAMILNLTYSILVIFAINAGNGRHEYYLGTQELSDAIRWNSIAFIPGILAFAVPKLGVALLLMRLLNPGKAQRAFMYFITIVCIIGSCLAAILLWRQCSPPQLLWNPNIKGKCWKSSGPIIYYTVHGAFSASTDFYLAIYPCTVMYKLQISTKRKVGLSAVLSLGFIAGIFAIYKCTRLQGLHNHSDYTYSTVDLLIWTSIESSFIIIAADLPTLRPIFQIMIGRPATGQEHVIDRRRSSYKLKSLTDSASSRKKKGPREPYPTDTIDLVGKESEERILPSNRIQKTLEVNVNHHTDQGPSAGSLGLARDNFGEV